MSTLAQHKHHLGALHDIRDIMAALKNISLTESQRLRRFLENQQRVMDGIERAMRDFLSHYLQIQPEDESNVDIVLVIGSERGFCGDFNEALLDSIRPAAKQRHLIAVGEKLVTKLDELQIHAETVTGLTTVEDVPEIILAVIDRLQKFTAQSGPTRLAIVHHYFDGHTQEVRHLQPFRHLAPESTSHGYPPLLNVPPESFFPQLLDHYLFAVLHGVMYGSLAAEHQQRLQHLQGAIENIDRQCAVMRQRFNNLRQELITEEIELIVLSTGTYLQE